MQLRKRRRISHKSWRYGLPGALPGGEDPFGANPQRVLAITHGAGGGAHDMASGSRL